MSQVADFVLYGLKESGFDVFLLWDGINRCYQIYREIDDEFLKINWPGAIIIKKSSKVENGYLLFINLGSTDELFGRKYTFVGKFSFRSNS